MLTIPRLCGKGCYTMKWWRWELQLCGHLWDQSKDEENPFYCEFLQISLFKLQSLFILYRLSGQAEEWNMHCSAYACYLNTLSFSLQDSAQLQRRRKFILFFLCPAHEPQMAPRHSQVTSTQAKIERRKGNLGVGKFFHHHCLRQILPSLHSFINII